MSSPVHRIHYEVIGDGLAIAAAHYAKVAERVAAGFALSKSLGGEGFRPGAGAKGMRHVLFEGKEAPEGWRFEQREGPKVACVPYKRSAIGKAAVAAMAEYENPPNGEALARALGHSTSNFIMDGYKFYYPSDYRFQLPTERIFLDIPRQADDGWTPPEHLREVPASTFMLAMEAHNAAVRALESEAGS